MVIQVINKSTNELPAYATEHSSGMDLKAYMSTASVAEILKKCRYSKAEYVPLSDGRYRVTIQPQGRALIPTGLYVSIPVGYEIQVRPKSGLAINKGITVLNTPGTVDADYRGEIGVILINHSCLEYSIYDGDEIAQAVLCPVDEIVWREVEVLTDTARGTGGFGSTTKPNNNEKASYYVVGATTSSNDPELATRVQASEGESTTFVTGE